MRITVLAVGFVMLLLFSVSGARAEFVIKHFIDGQIWVPSGGPLPVTNPVQEMDGDPTSPEMIVFGAEYHGYPYRQLIGITHVTNGQTKWFDSDSDRARLLYPTQGYPIIGEGSVLDAPPLFYDVDGDGLLDALIPVYDGLDQSCKTAVIGWVGSAAVNNPSGETHPAVLEQSRPNPSGGETSIAFTLSVKSQVRLSIYDVSGRLLSQLTDGVLAGGRYSIPWDGRDSSGSPVAAGTYFYQLTVDGREESKQMIVLR